MSAGTDKASAVLFDFMLAMKEWDRAALSPFSQAKSQLQPIYEKYVRKRDRKYRLVAGPSVGWPPKFDPEAETIVATQSVNDRKVAIETCGRIFPAIR
jgi:hypothetical protein